MGIHEVRVSGSTRSIIDKFSIDEPRIWEAPDSHSYDQYPGSLSNFLALSSLFKWISRVDDGEVQR